MNIIDIVQNKKQKLLDAVEHFEQEIEEEGRMHYEITFRENVGNDAEYYARLCILRDNFKNGVEDPYKHISDHDKHDEYYNISKKIPRILKKVFNFLH
ncbi:hypothetical protein [Bacillus sp. OV322]|uniref:hypothetical protein n=1 Tax=Bacillus sp. OV322 TaxID=1882764 RepID=UPI000B88997D|nr:hypothetical protein [Bacillus sp. OV322]